MIENINLRTFGSFGNIYENADAFAGDESIRAHTSISQTIAAQAPAAFSVLPDASVALDYGMGMTALYVYDRAQDAIRAYYLDKPVVLFPGIPFCLRPIGEESDVRLYLPEGAALLAAPVSAPMPSLALVPRLAIPRIFTLFYQEKPKGFFFRGESHDPYELFYVDHGTLQCIVAGQSFTLQQHDLMVVLPGQWHIQYADPEASVAFFTISFAMEGPGLEQLGSRVYKASSAIIRLLERMLSLQRNPGPWSADTILNALGRLVLLLLDAPGDTSPEAIPRHDAIAETNENRLVDAALRYIEANLSHPLTVAEVAGHVCISPSYLAVLFRRHLQMTPMAYIHKLKLEEGRRLIHQGEMTITQVAQHLGFATLQHFSRLFKHYFHLSPREYARSLR